LLTWFDRQSRDLPWRRDRDPYRIWVSEIMLQQTLVATVIPYFERFLAAFPDVTTLAEADEQEVLRLWEGLGYYRRARNLHQAARRLLAENAGQLSDDLAVWQDLPGVGRYILGAVLSQAFDRKLPIVEANSQRLLCRLFGQTGDPKSTAVKNWLWQTAEVLLPNKRVGDFNQALMELGSQVCTIVRPSCGECPLAKCCVANREQLQERIPLRTSPPPITKVNELAIVVWKGKQVLITRRPDSGRWANMWEFPRGEFDEGDGLANAAQRLLADLTGLQAEISGQLLTVVHTITRFRITLVCLEARYWRGSFRSSFYEEARWVLPSELTAYPVSSPQRKLAQHLLQK
jgi:A/G-specific adenine glycosylase